MTQAMPLSSRKGLHPIRKLVIAVLAIVLLVIAWVLYSHNHHAAAPSKSTTQSNPNVPQNTPPGGSVTEGGNPNSPTTPSPTGTNGVPDAGNGR